MSARVVLIFLLSKMADGNPSVKRSACFPFCGKGGNGEVEGGSPAGNGDQEKFASPFGGGNGFFGGGSPFGFGQASSPNKPQQSSSGTAPGGSLFGGGNGFFGGGSSPFEFGSFGSQPSTGGTGPTATSFPAKPAASSPFSFGSQPTAPQPSSHSSEPVCYCGLSSVGAQLEWIVGGQETDESEYPWQVGMVIEGGTDVFCGGSLISNRWVLTAAHCTEVDGVDTNSIEILLGDHDTKNNFDTQAIRMRISQIIPHPQYNKGAKWNNDFSLLKMKSAVDFVAYPHISPICLPVDNRNDYHDFTATVSGWGTLESGGEITNKLREVDVKVLTNSACVTEYDHDPKKITNNMLCAFGSGKDSCQGDSGGPLVSSGTGDGFTPGQNFDLIGVVSWGKDCADKDYPGVYARVSTQLQWIYSTTAQGWNTCTRE